MSSESDKVRKVLHETERGVHDVGDEAAAAAVGADGTGGDAGISVGASGAALSADAVVVDERGLTPRQAFLIIALVLFVVLLALILYLLLVKPASNVSQQTQQSPGLESVLVLTGPGTGPTPTFKQPMSAAWGEGNRIYVADTGNNRIVAFNQNGKFLFEFGTFGIAKPLPGAKATWKPGSLNYPTGVSVDRETGEVYVADFYNNTIEVFDGNGKYLRNFPDPNKVTGKGGSGINGHGIAVTDVAVKDGRVYATDAFQVFVFDRSGTLLRQYGKPGAAAGDLDRPNGITAIANGGVIVADSNHSRLTAYDEFGKPVQTIGEQVRGLSAPTTNPFVLPRGLATLEDGSVIVADPLSMQLIKIGLKGDVAAKYGERGTYPAQFNFPNDVDANGKLLLVADRGNDRVQVVKMVGR